MKEILCELMNTEIGEELRKLRKQKGYTQEGLRMKLEEQVEKELMKKGLSEEEVCQFIDNKISKDLESKLKQSGIILQKYEYHAIAISTISKYENGVLPIPKYYFDMVKKICSDKS